MAFTGPLIGVLFSAVLLHDDRQIIIFYSCYLHSYESASSVRNAPPLLRRCNGTTVTVYWVGLLGSIAWIVLEGEPESAPMVPIHSLGSGIHLVKLNPAFTLSAVQYYNYPNISNLQQFLENLANFMPCKYFLKIGMLVLHIGDKFSQKCHHFAVAKFSQMPQCEN